MELVLGFAAGLLVGAISTVAYAVGRSRRRRLVIPDHVPEDWL